MKRKERNAEEGRGKRIQKGNREGSKEQKKGGYDRIRTGSQQRKRGEKMEGNEERMGFCGGGCDGFVGHVSPGCQGAPVWWYGGWRADKICCWCRGAERGWGKKQGLSLIHPSLSLPHSPFFLTQTQTPSNPFYQKSC